MRKAAAVNGLAACGRAWHLRPGFGPAGFEKTIASCSLRGTVKRSPLACLLLATIATPALADNLDITSVLNTPVATATAANGTPGNITIETAGGVSINAAGAAVVLNSNNTIDAQGIIQNSFTGNGAIGIHVLGGNTGSLITEVFNTSIINVAG